MNLYLNFLIILQEYLKEFNKICLGMKDKENMIKGEQGKVRLRSG